MSLPPIKLEASPAEDDLVRRTHSELQVFSHSLHNLLLRGLSAPTIEDWLKYWREPEQWVSFVDFSRALHRALHDLDTHEELHRKAYEDAFWAHVAEAYPSRAAELEELKSKLAEIDTLVRTVLDATPLHSDDLKSLETELIRMFNAAQHWISIGVNSLQLAADIELRGASPRIPAQLIEGILELTSARALDALHTAYEGAQLHVPPAERIYATFTSRISRTEDGQGFIGACQELELMTCGETRDEMHRLIVDLVIGYLNAEAKRGNLGRILTSRLKALGEEIPSNLSLRLPVIDGDTTYCAFVEMTLSR